MFIQIIMKIFIVIAFTFIANTFSFLTEQVSTFVPQQEKSIITKPKSQTSSIDKINNIDINMRDIIIAIDTRKITETNNSNNKKRRKRNRRRRRRNCNHSNDRNKQTYTQNNYNDYYQEDINYNDNNDDTIINQYNLDNKYY